MTTYIKETVANIEKLFGIELTDEQEEQLTVSVELDNLSVVDTVDITSGLISSGSVVYLNGGLHTFFAYKVSESNDYIGRQKMLLYNK